MSNNTCNVDASKKQFHQTSLARRIVFIIGFCSLAAGLWAGWKTIRNRPDETIKVAFGGKARTSSMTVEVFLPTSAEQVSKRVPAILLVHGVEGAKRYAGHHHATARAFTDEGYAVFFVHYFDALDYEDLWYLNSNGDLDTQEIERWIERDKRQWISAVSTALCHVATRPEVDVERISLVGYSLGSFISYSVGQESIAEPTIPDVACIVGNWGAKFADVKFTAGYPESLLIHGEKDRVVKPAWARQTLEEIQAVGTAAKLIIVPDADHPAFSNKTWQATLDFLRQQFQSIAARRLVVNPLQDYQLVQLPSDFRWPRFP